MKKNSIKTSGSDIANSDKLSEFEERLNSVRLSDKHKNKIIDKNVSGKLVEVGLEILGPVGGAIDKINKLGDETKKDIRERKRECLLAEYFKDTENLKRETEKMGRFVTNPYGSMLYTKIIFLLDENTPNSCYIKMLSKALKKVINTNFERFFEEHKYALDLIAKISPQALIILADCPRWPSYYLSNYASNKGVVTSKWVDEFVEEYAKDKNIINSQTKLRISHALNELFRLDLVRSVVLGAKDSKDFGSIKDSANEALCLLTDLGEEILTYIDPETFEKWRDTETKKGG